MLDIKIQYEQIHSDQLRKNLPSLAHCGGYCCFEGIIRNHNHGKEVSFLSYEAYEELALSELKRIAANALETFDLSFARAHHRIGRLEIGDVAVIIQVQAKHRDEAFRGCRYIIDELKKTVPIWKKEHYQDGQHSWTRCNHA